MRLLADEIIGGRYRLERLIGEGGMGMVWSAIDQEAGERVALKLLKEDGKKNDLLVRRFAREARAAMAVAHPNVVKIRDILNIETGDEIDPVIVMDYLEGESLATRIERVRRLRLQEFAEIFVGVVSAIGTAHAAGIVHRDLKPDNVFLVRTPEGREEARVVDFGIAKLTALEGEAKQTGGLTTTGAVLGTPYYMSPEQVFGDKNIDHRSDIWSLGLIIFECLAGFRAVEGENIGQLLKVITTGAIPRLRDAVPTLPEDVLELDERMLSPDRTKRPYDLREVLNIFRRHATRDAASFGEATLPGDIRNIRDIHPALARAGDVSPHAETLSAPPNAVAELLADKRPFSTTGGAAISAEARPSKPAPGRRPLWSALAAAAVLCVVGGLGFVTYRAADGGVGVGQPAQQVYPGAPQPIQLPAPNATPNVFPGAPQPVPSEAPAPSTKTAAIPPIKTNATKPNVVPAPKASASATSTTTAATPTATTASPTGLQGAVGQEDPYKAK